MNGKSNMKHLPWAAIAHKASALDPKRNVWLHGDWPIAYCQRIYRRASGENESLRKIILKVVKKYDRSNRNRG